MASVKGITIGGQGLSTGFGVRACRIKGNGVAVIVKGVVLYGPTGTPNRSAELVLTHEQALNLAESLKKTATNLAQYVNEFPNEYKLMEAP